MGDTPSTAENIISQEVLTNSVVQVDCYICKRIFRTNRGLVQNLNTCRRKDAANATNFVNNEGVDDIYQANGYRELFAGTDLLHWNNGYISILKTSIMHTRKLFIGEKIYSRFQQALQKRSLSTRQQKC